MSIENPHPDIFKICEGELVGNIRDDSFSSSTCNIMKAMKYVANECYCYTDIIQSLRNHWSKDKVHNLVYELFDKYEFIRFIQNKSTRNEIRIKTGSNFFNCLFLPKDRIKTSSFVDYKRNLESVH